MDDVYAHPAADIYAFDFYDVWPSGIDLTPHYSEAKMIYFSTPQERLYYVSGPSSHRDMGYACWSKLYRREFIEDHQIWWIPRDVLGVKNDWCEDLLFNLQCFLHAGSICMTGKPTYLLTKRGIRESGYAVGNRVFHMTTLLKYAFEELSGLFPDENSKEQFYAIFIWHMKRYFYEGCQLLGIKILREHLQTEGTGAFALAQIEKGLCCWSSLKDRWPEADAADYRAMLQYLADGNYLRFRLSNYWRWKIKPMVRRG